MGAAEGRRAAGAEGAGRLRPGPGSAVDPRSASKATPIVARLAIDHPGASIHCWGQGQTRAPATRSPSQLLQHVTLMTPMRFYCQASRNPACSPACCCRRQRGRNMKMAVEPVAPGVVKVILNGRLDVTGSGIIDLQFSAVAGSHSRCRFPQGCRGRSRRRHVPGIDWHQDTASGRQGCAAQGRLLDSAEPGR